jgi:uncharacterized protein
MPAYKLSRFTHVLSSSDSSKRYVYNPVSNGLAAVDDAVAEMLLQGDAGIDMLGSKAEHAQLLNDLRSGQMIVEEDLDEVEFMRVKMNLSRYGTLGLSLTIVPTLGCNLACTYCYEGLDSVRFMSPEVQESVVAFAKAQVERFGYRSLSVTWYGGEPLLRPELIYDLSRKLIDLCDELKIHYTAMVVTNGTTLTPAMAQELKDLKVSHIQVTIDGPREVHDLRRPFRGHTRSSFDVITSNVDRIVDILPVHIRINVDKTNYQRCLELVDQMRSKGWFESGRQCGFYLGFTRVWTQVCNSIANQCFTMKQFSETELKFQRDLLNAGFTLGNLYPARTA